MNITIKTDEYIFEVYIDGLLHFAYQKVEFVAMYSYIDDDGILPKTFHILFKFKTTELKLEYDKKCKWESILKAMIT